MRFHLLGVPHTVSSISHSACAFTQKVVKFGQMMTERGHTVYHYGHQDSDIICTEHIPVVTEADWKGAYGDHDWRKHFFKYDTQDSCYQTFYKNSIAEILKRREKHDFLLPFWGSGVREICDKVNDMIVIEPGIGYSGGIWTYFKCFESYSILNCFYGQEGVNECKQGNYDYVIPNYFNQDDFEYREKKDDYYLFIGRVYGGKGVDIAIETVRRVGGKLLIAGQNAEQGLKELGYDPVPGFVEIVGYADVPTRKRLMAGAKACIIPSQFLEPFAGVQVECMFAGTPTLTNDWGVFNENNWHGVTGYRCRTIDQYVWGLRNIDRIRPRDCREYAIKNFSLHRVAEIYEDFFESVLDVHTNEGWYQLHPHRQNLDYNYKKFPRMSTKVDYAANYANDVDFASQFAQAVKSLIPAKLVIDLGCETGVFTNALCDVGLPCLGVDHNREAIQKSASKVAPAKIVTKEKRTDQFIIKDIFRIEKDEFAADLVLALDLAGQVDPQHEEYLFKAILNSMADTSVLIWSAPAPGVANPVYFNWRTKADWQKRLSNQGLIFDQKLTESLLTKLSDAPDWFARGCLCFRKES